MLVHHADAERGGIIGVVDLDGLAVFADLARLRLIQAEEHAHERGFAGAVFTEQGVDLALFELQGDVVVGLDARELLGDVKHFDHIRRSVVHTATYFPISVSVLAYRQPPDGEPRCPAREMALLVFRLYLFDRLISRHSAPNVYRTRTKKREKACLSHSKAILRQAKRRESRSFLSARAKTRSFSPGPRRRPPGGNESHPRRALHPLGLPRGARVCTRRGCSGTNKKRRESVRFLSLKGIRSNYLTRLRVT